jgi:hypothetical protein
MKFFLQLYRFDHVTEFAVESLFQLDLIGDEMLDLYFFPTSSFISKQIITRFQHIAAMPALVLPSHSLHNSKGKN